MSVLRPLSSPGKPPNRYRTAMDFGSISLDRCPGEKANGLFSRLKRCSSPGFGCIAAGYAVSWDDDPTVCSTPAEGIGER